MGFCGGGGRLKQNFGGCGSLILIHVDFNLFSMTVGRGVPRPSAVPLSCLIKQSALTACLVFLASWFGLLDGQTGVSAPSAALQRFVEGFGFVRLLFGVARPNPKPKP